MSRFYSLGSWFCTSVAIALALLVPLTVPEGAFADSGMTCYENCQTSCYNQCGNDPTCIANCMGPCAGSCCASACGTDSSCGITCCQEACQGDLNCADTCSLDYTQGCAGDGCSIPSNPCKPTWWPACPDTNTNCANGTIKSPCNGCICRDVGAGLDKCGCRLKP